MTFCPLPNGPSLDEETSHLIDQLSEIGIALSAQKEPRQLLNLILRGAKNILNADAGTLYLVDEAQTALHFEIIANDTLGIFIDESNPQSPSLPPVALYDDQGRPNTTTVAAYAALNSCTVNIPDAYAAAGFDFTGTRKFDARTGYRSCSFLTVPMKNHENALIGVLQLINAKEPGTGAIIPFSPQSQRLAESLASQAAIALSNNRLIEEFRLLFESFIELIAEAIDNKSPYTGKHCRRVPELTMMLAEAACRSNHGIFRNFTMTDEELYELRIAGLLHDCGKVTTPVHVIDKATKLETIFDRIHLIDTRFEVLKRDAEIELLRQKLAALEAGTPELVPALESAYHAQIAQYDTDRHFLRTCNIGGESMRPEDQERVRRIGQYRWINANHQEEPFLSDNELYNLTIARGTLTPEERQIINDHIVVTINMLEKLPYPKNLRRVPEYAGGHHERMDGKGYPRGLTREQMSIPARMMGIADVFEALSAKDRPYKKGKTLSECLQILGKFCVNQHIDPDIFDLFVREKIYLRYAATYLDPDQIDAVDERAIPGYNPDRPDL
jgi:HD-GYP domain-containing protein (c-di-GMP phosphodiesterase class II)